MSAIRELGIFCGQHPEIRAHKTIGELLRLAEEELADLSARIAELEPEDERLKAELDKANNTLDYRLNVTDPIFEKKLEQLKIAVDEAEEKINIALKTLPDSEHEDDSWGWAWEELSGEAQTFVKDTRLILFTWLKEYGGKK